MEWLGAILALILVSPQILRTLDRPFKYPHMKANALGTFVLLKRKDYRVRAQGGQYVQRLYLLY